MSSLRDDFGFAWNALRKSPGFLAVAVITLALGIGTNAAIFSIVNAVLLKPLDLPDPDRLVFVNGEMRQRNVDYFPMSPPNFRELSEATDLLEGLATYNTFGNTLKEPGASEGEPVQVAGISNSFFEVAGVRPVQGRAFEAADAAFSIEDVPEGTQFPLNTFAPAKTALISHELWQRRFAGRKDILGHTVDLGGVMVEIVGIMPEGFQFEMPAETGNTPAVDLWLPQRIDYDNALRDNVFMHVFGRLKENVTIEQAQAQLDAFTARQRDLYEVRRTAGWYAHYRDLHSAISAPVRNSVLILMAAVFFVLLIAAANVANLLLVRASTRSRETAIRAALGGSRQRLLRQMLIEAGIIAGGGALLGLGLAEAGIRFLHALGPDGLPREDLIRLDLNVVAFTVLIAAAATLLAGILPALKASRPDLVNELRERSGSSRSSGGKVFRDAMVVLEVTLSFVLLVGAGLMVRSFLELQNIDPGFNPERVLTFNLNLPNEAYPLPADQLRFVDELYQRIQDTPGIEAVGTVGPLPLTGGGFNGRYAIEAEAGDQSAYRQAGYRAVKGDYFKAMQTPLLAGRLLNRDDEINALPYVVIDDLMVKRAFPDVDPIGQKLMVRFGPEPTLVEVVGVVAHQAAVQLQEEGLETLFMTNELLGFGPFGSWAVRTATEPTAMTGTLRELIAQMDPNVSMQQIQTMEELVDDAQGPTWFALSLISIFGAIALMLASVGLYSVLAYIVRLRQNELGVRIAFGATPARIFKLVVGRGLALAVIGAAIGVAVGLSVTRWMENLLIQVQPDDPVTFTSIAGLFLAIAFLASFMPARRATRVDPVVSLRWE